MVWIEPLDARRLLSVSTLQNNWATIGNGPAHSGYVAGTTAGLAYSNAWTALADTGTGAPIAVGGGRVYATKPFRSGSGNNIPAKLYAVDAASGSLVWTREFPASSNGIAPPTYFNGRIYLQWSNYGTSQLYALDATTGQTLWTSPYSSQWDTHKAPAVDESGIWINGGTYGGLYGFRHDGTQIAFSYVPQNDNWTPSLDGDGVYVWLDYKLHKFDKTGKLVWRNNITDQWPGTLGSLVAIDDGSAFATLGDDLFAFDTATGTLKWRKAVSAQAAPAIANGIVYTPTFDGVRAYSASDGSYLRSYGNAPNGIPSGSFDDTFRVTDQPIVTDDVVILTTKTKTSVYSLDGTLRQSFDFTASSAVDHGTLYLRQSNGILNAYDLGVPLRGVIFNDSNSNGTRDAGEGASLDAAAGVYLDLDQSGTLTGGDVTASNADAGGLVQFNVSPGTYTARLVLPPGATATTADSATVTVPAGGGVTLPAFGLLKTYVVSGVARRDYDANGVGDHGVFEGRTIYADLDGDGILDANEPASVTDADGRYALALPAGAYTIRQVLPAAYVQTGRTGGADLTFTKTGRVEVTADAGPFDLLSRPPQTLVVAAFNDTDADGVLDASETLNAAGNFVFLDLNNDGTHQSIEPSDLSVNGVAAFAVEPGAYTVRLVSADPSRAAKPVDGQAVTVSGGAVATTAFAMQYVQTASGTVFTDHDADGVQDPGEPAFITAGVRAYVDSNNSGTFEATEISAMVTDGAYVLTNLPPGEHVVRLAFSPFFGRLTAPAIAGGGQTFAVAAGGTATVGTFGIEPYYRATVWTFNDVNGDGLRGSNEFELYGTPYVDLNDNGSLDNGEPNYSMGGVFYLPAGTYRLRAIAPVGYRETGRDITVRTSATTFTLDGRVRLPADEDAGTLYFGFKYVPVVNVLAFHDLNGNGVQNQGEPTAAPASGFVYIDRNENGVYDPGTDITGTPGANGSTEFRPPNGTHVFRQSLQAGWAQTQPTLNSGRTITITDSTRNLATTFGRWQPPPTVQSITVDDGSVQRSRVRSISIVFSGEINPTKIGKAAFTLTQISGVAAGPFAGVVNQVFLLGDGRTRIVLTFAGTGLSHGSLPDGRYRLKIDGSNMLDITGATIDAAGTGVRGTSRTFDFARLSSDGDGNGTVDFNDFLLLQNAFASTVGSANFLIAFDSDNNGVIDFSDFLVLQNDFGHVLNPVV